MRVPKIKEIKRMVRRNWKQCLLLSLPFIPAIILGLIGVLSQLLFTFDQARDAFEALSILQGNIKILGPATDITSVYHGVLWYYLLAIPYGVLQDPQLVAIFFFLISLITIPLSGIVAFRLTQSKTVAYSTMLLYAYSPLFQAFSRWLSNPVYTLYVMPFLLYFLWEFLSKPKKLPSLILGVCFGLLIQSDFAFGIFLVFLPVYLLVYRVRVQFSHIGLFILGLVLSLFTFFLAEIKFHGQSLFGLYHFLFSGGHTLSNMRGEQFILFLQKLYQLISYTISLQNQLITILVAVALLLVVLRNRQKFDKKPILFLLIWLCNILIFQFFHAGIVQSAFVFAPSLLVIIMLISYLFVRVLTKKTVVVVVILIILLQSMTTATWLHDMFTPLMVQNGMYLIDQKKVVDYTYSSGKDFSINTVTNPLYINTTWAYLYEHYGKRKYGYLPTFLGKDQTGYLGNLPMSSRNETIYLIEEPGPGIPPLYYQITQDETDEYSIVKEVKKIGKLRVEKREYRSGSK